MASVDHYPRLLSIPMTMMLKSFLCVYNPNRFESAVQNDRITQGIFIPSFEEAIASPDEMSRHYFDALFHTI